MNDWLAGYSTDREYWYALHEQTLADAITLPRPSSSQSADDTKASGRNIIETELVEDD